MKPRFIARRSLLLAALLAGSTPLMAQTAGSYPSQPIKIIVPYPAGGATDTLARMIGAKLSEGWKQPVIIENRPGASGNIGSDAVAKAPGDGYTVLMGITALIQASALYRKLPYDPIRDLVPVAEVARSPSIFAVPASSPAKTMRDFIIMAKSNPSRYNYGSYGTGTSSHIQGSLLNLQAGLDLTHIPYKGAAPLVNDLIGGQLASAFVDAATARPHLKTGSFRVLAVTGAQRMPSLPDVPTFTELGFHSYGLYGWFGLFMPSSTPKPVVNKFSNEVGKILRTPEVSAKIADLGLMVVGNKPEEFSRSVKSDAEVYAKIIKQAGITLD